VGGEKSPCPGKARGGTCQDWTSFIQRENPLDQRRSPPLIGGRENKELQLGGRRGGFRERDRDERLEFGKSDDDQRRKRAEGGKSHSVLFVKNLEEKGGKGKLDLLDDERGA